MRGMNTKIRKKINKVSFIVFLTIGLIIGWQSIKAQTIKDSQGASSTPFLSRLALLSIHVSSAAIHDSVYHLLTDKLGLSVDYYPLTYAGRRYTAVYAGNMYLEPCGPFSNFTYASKNFKAIFFGLNCGSERPLPSIAEELTGKNIKIEKGDAILVTDSSLIKPNIYFAIAAKAAPVNSDDSLQIGRLENKKNKREDSLRLVMLENNKTRLGIERIKEVRVGYKDNEGLKKWKDLIKPSELAKDGLWKPIEGPPVRLVKSNIREVNAIVFKVQSLKKAKTYLIENNLLGSANKNEIALDKSKTFGLSIFLCEE
jgi:hypothetical protein